MFSISNNNRLYDPILGATDKVVKSANTLGRLNRLNDYLVVSGFMRSKGIKALRDFWVQIQNDLSQASNLESMSRTIKEGLSQITTGLKRDKKIHDCYVESIEAARTIKELNKCINKNVKDIESLLTFVFQKTQKGQNGPTHLISYTRSKDSFPQFRNYVVKWSNWNEICSWRLYSVISKSFVVPKTAALDFEKNLHEQGNEIAYELDDQISAYLKQSFLDAVGKSTQVQDAQLMLMEKVRGSNLIDFTETKYKFLNQEQKVDLFQKMGNLAMLDLLMGNTDRLIQTKYDGTSYQLEDLTANLGNLMIEWLPNEDQALELYAIDNGITSALITNETQKNAYNQFVQSQLKDANQMSVIADTIIRSIINSFKDVAEDSTNRLAALEKFDPMLNDLKTDALKTALEKGLQEMFCEFKDHILPFWDSEKSLKVKNHLEKNHPALLNVISERFQLFKIKG